VNRRLTGGIAIPVYSWLPCEDAALFTRFLTYKLRAGRFLSRYTWLSCSELSRERQPMINSKNVVSALRRDVTFVWHAVIAVVFIGFATLAVAAALLDLLSIRH
jgi:hypothetical protein